jgi:cytochrome c oxidase subunit 2
MDAVPGRINTMWVMPDATGEYLIQCREYCGYSHFQMRAKLFVEEGVSEVSADRETTDVPVSFDGAAGAIASH